MTNKEAITIFRKYENCLFGILKEPINMAIKALETATNCKTKEDVICKLLEWCSRPIAKGVPYATNKRNIEWRSFLLCGYNDYLDTNFTQDDMYWIYDKLGNAVNHELTLEFIHSGFDLSLVRPQKSDHKCHTCKHYTSGENDGSCGSYICKGYSNWESEDEE